MLSSSHLLPPEEIAEGPSTAGEEASGGGGDDHSGDATDPLPGFLDDQSATGDRGLDGEDGSAAAEAVTTSAVGRIRYDRHKPKWWKQRVGRYVTNPQRRAMEEMRAYCLVKPPHGQVLHFDECFSGQERTGAGADSFKPKQVWMELGFGNGDNLLCLAQRDPGSLFVGVEVHASSIAICLQRIQQSLEDNESWDGYELYSEAKDPFPVYSVELHMTSSSATGEDSQQQTMTIANPLPPSSDKPYQNVRVYGGDGIVLLENGIAPSSLDVVLITFPDPFPSDKPHRILQVHTVNTMFQCLKPTGRIILATDHEGFYDWANDVVEEWNAVQGQQLPRPRLIPTMNMDRRDFLPVVSRYERKGWEEGRRTLLAGWYKDMIES